ncbi:unnamed protein product [Cyprideis torosa]|uniref:Oligomycin sensitivity conferral protein n=1 Tax=Cyprideis torosa TaxID=163714 RepID=A0A7R8W6G5_9CRUS|nr:unnamed protein product [Cyprideis torosa]CAG0886488.1 unnamed protein product [Cyprideis torosa]
MASRQVFSMTCRFASSSASQMVKPPIQLFGLEGRYATALYSAAAKESKLEIVEKELREFNNLLKTDPRLAEFVFNPTLDKNLKKLGVESVMKKKKASSLTANFMGLIVENGRANKINSMLESFFRLMSAHRGELECEIVTAKALDDATRKELEKVLQSFAKKDQKLLVTTKVDPSIIGGMIVSVGDRYVDMSIGSKMKKFTEILKTAA